MIAAVSAQTGQSGDLKMVPDQIMLASGTIGIRAKCQKMPFRYFSDFHVYLFIQRKKKIRTNVQMSLSGALTRFHCQHGFNPTEFIVSTNAEAVRGENAFGCQQKTKNPITQKKNTHLGPILQKKDIPAQPEAPLMKDQSLLMPQTRQFTGQRQI